MYVLVESFLISSRRKPANVLEESDNKDEEGTNSSDNDEVNNEKAAILTITQLPQYSNILMWEPDQQGKKEVKQGETPKQKGRILSTKPANVRRRENDRNKKKMTELAARVKNGPPLTKEEAELLEALVTGLGKRKSSIDHDGTPKP